MEKKKHFIQVAQLTTVGSFLLQPVVIVLACLHFLSFNSLLQSSKLWGAKKTLKHCAREKKYELTAMKRKGERTSLIFLSRSSFL